VGVLCRAELDNFIARAGNAENERAGIELGYQYIDSPWCRANWARRRPSMDSPISRAHGQTADCPVVRPASDTAIRVTGLSTTFNSRERTVVALDEVDLTIERGEFACVVGPSECGKTTLLNILGGLERWVPS
jgi:ABC-type multidrug transport system fused ATPase/permease subunit